MKLRKIVYLLSCLSVMLIFCGCNLELASPESLITPPKSNQEKLQQKQLVTSFLGREESLIMPEALDSANAYQYLDLDGDGKEESCTLGYGPTSGLFTVTLRVQENGENEYFNTYMLDHGDLSFVKTDSGWKLKLIPSLGDLEVVYYSFSVRDGNIVLTHNSEEAFYWGEQGLHSPWSGIQMDESGNILSAGSHPEYVTVYEETPVDQIEETLDKEEFVIRETHYQDVDGSWVCNGYSYLYRLEVTGRKHASEKNSTYLILSNRKDITFDQAWKASGFSSNLNDYFTPDEAVIVGIKLF